MTLLANERVVNHEKVFKRKLRWFIFFFPLSHFPCECVCVCECECACMYVCVFACERPIVCVSLSELNPARNDFLVLLIRLEIRKNKKWVFPHQHPYQRHKSNFSKLNCNQMWQNFCSHLALKEITSKWCSENVYLENVWLGYFKFNRNSLN